MAQKLKIIALGGLHEIGKNLMVYEYQNDIIIVDCGLGFPDDDMLGIDLVVPDVSYLAANQHKIRGIILTHGHEDHIGALPYVLREINAPIYATRLTAALVELKLKEHKLLANCQIITKEAGEKFKLGCFGIEFIHVNHSIADSVALAIKTPIGMVVHTGDFKIDPSPVKGGIIDLGRFGTLGKEGVLALLMDSTGVERKGYSNSETSLIGSFDALFAGCDKRIIVTTFASNVDRIQQVINTAAKYGRKVAVTGRSMENILKMSTELGYTVIPSNILIDINQAKSLPKNKVVIVTTGSQGESMSALYRMAFSSHKQVEIGSDDKVIISASAIPGNEKGVAKVINELFARGAEVAYNSVGDLHVSGHACQEELKIIQALTKPKFLIPVHGETRHLKMHAALGKQMGIEPNHVIISENGKVLELTKKTCKFNGTVPSGEIMVDGLGVGDVGSVVLRDRKHLAQDGMIVVLMNFSGDDGELVTGPEIITRGFVYVKESEDLMEQLKNVALAAVGECRSTGTLGYSAIKSCVKERMSGYLFKKTKRNPMIPPVITEI